MFKCRFFLYFILAVVIIGCKTTRVLDNGVSTSEVRDSLSELGKEQAGDARNAQAISDTSANLAETSREITETSNNLAESISGAIGKLEEQGTDNREFKKLCEQIREQPAGKREDLLESQ